MAIPSTDEQVGAILEAIREAAPQLTESVVQMIFWRGVIDATVCLISLAAATFFAVHGLRWGKKAAEGDDWGNPVPMFAAAGCWFFALIVGAVSLISIGDAILKITSPEGVAIARLLRVY